MKMSRLIALFVLLIGLALPAQARAGWEVDRATEIAATVWHDPCAGKVALHWVDLRTIGVTDAWAASDEKSCSIYYDTRSKTNWSRFCTITLHEYGHLAGYRDPSNTDDPTHSRDPFSVMYADQRPDINTDGYAITAMRHGRRVQVPAYDARCADRGRTFLAAHGL